MENFVTKKWLRRLGIAIGVSLAVVLCLSAVALAVGTILSLSGIATDTTIALTWVKSTSTDNTTIQYSTSSFPATHTDGTNVYSGSANYYDMSGLTAGTNYYISAFAYDGATYSAPKQLLVTTQVTVAENATIPYSQPAIPTEAWQNPDTSGWSIHPIDDILAYFSDPSYTHGGLGMPTDNLVMFIAGLIVTGIGLLAYIKWHNFFTAYVIVFIASFFCVGIHVMQGYIIGLELLIGMGVWAVEHNFQ